MSIEPLISQINDPVSLGVQIALAVGTWVLVGVSVHFMRRSAKAVTESNQINKDHYDLAKVELKARLKPVIAFESIRASIQTKREEVNMSVLGTM